ncbi:MAG: hypothetical protein WKF47_04110, partial [Geodermatophilaceae bacterium]
MTDELAASGLINASLQVGTSVLLAGTVAVLSAAATADPVGGYRAALLAGAALALTAALLARRLPATAEPVDAGPQRTGGRRRSGRRLPPSCLASLSADVPQAEPRTGLPQFSPRTRVRGSRKTRYAELGITGLMPS